MSSTIIKMCSRYKDGHGYCALREKHKGDCEFPPLRQKTYTQSDLDAALAKQRAELLAPGPCGKHPVMFWISSEPLFEDNFGNQRGEIPAHCTLCLAEQRIREEAWMTGFELAHELQKCGHSRGDCRDPDYKPTDETCNSRCIGCDMQQKACDTATGEALRAAASHWPNWETGECSCGFISIDGTQGRAWQHHVVNLGRPAIREAQEKWEAKLIAKSVQVDGDILTYRGFRWQRLPPQVVEVNVQASASQEAQLKDLEKQPCYCRMNYICSRCQCIEIFQRAAGEETK